MSRIPRPIGYWLIPSLALIIATGLTLWPYPTTFSLSVQTESLSLVTGPAHQSIWYFSNVHLSTSDQPFSGSVQISPGVVVSIERIAYGVLNIWCRSKESTGRAAVAKLRHSDTRSEVIRESLLIRIEDLTDRAKRGETVVLSAMGDIELGTELGFDNGTSPALLRAGSIQLIGHSLLGRRRFTAQTARLAPGDYVRFENSGAFAGLILASDKPGVTAVMRAVAGRAKVSRFGGRGYDVELSIIDRVMSDGPLQATWTTALFIVAMAGYLRWSKKEGQS